VMSRGPGDHVDCFLQLLVQLPGLDDVDLQHPG
jgi:hypothetical protein